jgi:hypothetical protein
VTALQNTVSHYETLLESINTAWAVNVPNVPLTEALSGPATSRDAQDYAREAQRPTTSETGISQQASATQPVTAADIAPPQSVEPHGWHDRARPQERDQSPVTLASHRADTDTPEQSNAEDYEFDESQDFDCSTSGSGLLTMTTRKAGYTGPQSGIAALKLLSPLRQDTGTIPEKSSLSRVHNALYLEAAQAPSDIYVTQYFTYYHPYYPLLHEGLFRARVSGMSSSLGVLYSSDFLPE